MGQVGLNHDGAAGGVMANLDGFLAAGRLEEDDATLDGVSAQAQITILASGSTPAPGTALWSVPPVTGFSPLQLAQAMPSATGPDLYSTQLSASGAQTILQALTLDGQQMWQTNLPALNGNSVPDAYGGLIVVENQTCNNGQTQPMSIVDVDAATGQPSWQIDAAGIPGAGQHGTTLYCYPVAPQLAIRGDGAVAISAPGNTSGLPEFVIVSGTQGNDVLVNPQIPPSLYMNSLGGTTQGYSPIGPPIIDSNGTTYVEYEVRDVNSANQIISAILYLLSIEQAGPITSIQLSSTTNNENFFPGRIIPDGQGGVLATWVIVPANGSIPANPYQAAYVVSGSVTITYNLPFTPKGFVFGPDSLPLEPSLVLGENGVAFATDGSSSGDVTNGLGAKIISFNLASGSLNWTYQVTTQTLLSLIAAADGGGLAAKSTSNGTDDVLRFDSAGNATPDAWTAPDVSNYGGSIWLGYSSSGAANYYAAPVELSSSPFYGPDGNGNNSAKQNVSVAGFSQAGSNQNTITVVLQKIAAALPNNATCNNWLQGASKNIGTSGLMEVQDLLQSPSPFGHGSVTIGTAISYTTWAFSGALNPDNTLIPGLPSGIAMTVNDVAGFFNVNTPNSPPYNGVGYELGPRHYPGNSLRAQAMTLVHEVAHQITVSGFQDDFGNTKAGKANDKSVDTNCRQMIEGLQ
jgi:hypothetical protein